MSITLRIILIIGSIILFLLCLKKMRKSELKITNGVMWMFGSLILILMSIFSDAVGIISQKIGFMAPVNFVFLIIILFLLIQVFLMNLKIVVLTDKINQINQYIEKIINENNSFIFWILFTTYWGCRTIYI